MTNCFSREAGKNTLGEVNIPIIFCFSWETYKKHEDQHPDIFFHELGPYESCGGVRTTIRRRISVRIFLDGSQGCLKQGLHRKSDKSKILIHFFHELGPYESYGGLPTTIRRRISIRVFLDGSQGRLKQLLHQNSRIWIWDLDPGSTGIPGKFKQIKELRFFTFNAWKMIPGT